MIVELTISDVAQFCRSFPPEGFYLSTETVRTAILEKRQFNILVPATGLKFDVFVLNDTAFDQSLFSRRKQQELDGGLNAWFATPEDVILKKLVYYKEGESDKHIRDILGVLKIQGSSIDLDYLAHWTNQLDLTELWHKVLVRSEYNNTDTDDLS